MVEILIELLSCVLELMWLQVPLSVTADRT
jgi:hypothetical protein